MWNCELGIFLSCSTFCVARTMFPLCFYDDHYLKRFLLPDKPISYLGMLKFCEDPEKKNCRCMQSTWHDTYDISRSLNTWTMLTCIKNRSFHPLIMTQFTEKDGRNTSHRWAV